MWEKQKKAEKAKAEKQRQRNKGRESKSKESKESKGRESKEIILTASEYELEGTFGIGVKIIVMLTNTLGIGVSVYIQKFCQCAHDSYRILQMHLFTHWNVFDPSMPAVWINKHSNIWIFIRRVRIVRYVAPHYNRGCALRRARSKIELEVRLAVCAVEKSTWQNIPWVWSFACMKKTGDESLMLFAQSRNFVSIAIRTVNVPPVLFWLWKCSSQFLVHSEWCKDAKVNGLKLIYIKN